MGVAERMPARVDLPVAERAPKAASGQAWLWLAVVVLALLGAARVGRYQIAALESNGHPAVVRLDRWTGRVEVAPLGVRGADGELRFNPAPWLSLER